MGFDSQNRQCMPGAVGNGLRPVPPPGTPRRAFPTDTLPILFVKTHQDIVGRIGQVILTRRRRARRESGRATAVSTRRGQSATATGLSPVRRPAGEPMLARGLKMPNNDGAARTRAGGCTEHQYI